MAIKEMGIQDRDFWVKYNCDRIKEAETILGPVRMYQFDQEDKDKFLEAMKTFKDIVAKYGEGFAEKCPYCGNSFNDKRTNHSTCGLG